MRPCPRLRPLLCCAGGGVLAGLPVYRQTEMTKAVAFSKIQGGKMTRTKLRAFRLILTGLLVAATGAFAQSPIQITSPANLSSATEGQVVTITVNTSPAVQNLFVVAEFPLPDVQQ